MDIFTLLLIDHAKQRDLMKSILNPALDDGERLELFEELQAELMAHAAAEEQTLYARLLADAQGLIQQCVAGNDRVAELTFQLRDLDAGSPRWLAAFRDLKAEVESHHALVVAQLFPRARRLMKRNMAKQVGKCFEQVKLRELCLDGKCPLGRRPATSPVPIKRRQQLGQGFLSPPGCRGSRKRATSRGFPRAKGG